MKVRVLISRFFVILLFLSTSRAHVGSRTNLLGDHQNVQLFKKLSADENISPDIPPCFIWHTVADEAVPVDNSLYFALALQAQKIPYELHLYPEGRHGIGLNCPPPFENPHPWSTELVRWLRELRLPSDQLKQLFFQ